MPESAGCGVTRMVVIDPGPFIPRNQRAHRLDNPNSTAMNHRNVPVTPPSTICAGAPCRVDLFGNWSDDIALLPTTRSRVISFTISIGDAPFPANVSITKTRDPLFQYRSIDLSHSRAIIYPSVADNPICLSVLSAIGVEDNESLLDYISSNDGLTIESYSAFPFRSGLGTSAALTVCAWAASLKIINYAASPGQIAELSYQTENKVHRVGWQDHYAAAYGGANLITRHHNDTGAQVSPLSYNIPLLLETHGLLTFASRSPHGPIPWPFLDTVTTDRIKRMDALIDEILDIEHKLTVSVLRRFLSRNWRMLCYWYSNDMVLQLQQMLAALRPLDVAGVFIGSGPAVLLISETPSYVLRARTAALGINAFPIVPRLDGVAVYN